MEILDSGRSYLFKRSHKSVALWEKVFLSKEYEKWKQYQYETNSDPDDDGEGIYRACKWPGLLKNFYPHSKVTQYLQRSRFTIYLEFIGIKKKNNIQVLEVLEKPNCRLPCANITRVTLGIWLYVFALMLQCLRAWWQFCSWRMGDGYVEMTDEKSRREIRSEFKDRTRVNMFVAIAVNNIKGHLWRGADLLSIGTVWLLLRMSYAWRFQYMFCKRSRASVCASWLDSGTSKSHHHNCGGAGLIVGNGIVFPGTLSRAESLEKQQRWPQIMIGWSRVFIMAAFLKGL